jgi:hypothetical protein
MQQVIDALELLTFTPCTVTLTEEAHASGALSLREHPALTEESLACRMLLHNMRSLVSPSKHVKVLGKFQEKLDALDNRMPQKVGGRLVFLKTLVGRVTTLGPFTVKAKNLDTTRECFRVHASLYSNLPRLVKASFDAEALAHELEAHKRLAQERMRLRCAMHKVVTDELKRRLAHGDVVQMTSFKFTDADLEAMSDMMQSPNYSKLRIRREPSPSQLAPLCPSPQTIAALELIERELSSS